MNYEQRFNNAKWQTRASELNHDGVIFGYAAVFDSLSEEMGGFREKIRKGAFRKTILEDDIRMLFNHNQDYLLARNKSGTLKLWEDEKGLRFEATPPDTQAGRDLVTLIKRGDLTQNSFGFSIRNESLERTENGKVRILEEVRLYDISPVVFPAYPETSLGIKDTRQKKVMADRKSLERFDEQFFEAEGLRIP